MAVTTLTGNINTTQPIAAELKVDMRDAIAMLDVDTTQFMTMMMHPKFGTEQANSFKVEWLNDQFLPRKSALSASAASADTTLTLTASEGAYFRAGDVIRNTLTGEGMRVTTSGASAVTVVRGVGSVAAVSSASTNANIVIVGNAAAEGTTLCTRLITQRASDYNLALAA